jgi:dimethylhistidine N-methyltransferase
MELVMSIQSAVARHPSEDRYSVFARDVIEGLTARPKRLSPKYFYDETGSRLFEEITALPEYYPTRCELAILRAHADEMARLLPAETALIEFGSGSSRKSRLLLDAAPAIAAYVPVDISSQWLSEEAARLRRDYPRLAVLPVAADFTQAFRLPRSLATLGRAGFFPGSTIGNFEPHQACAFLQHAARILGENAILIVGIDLVKDAATLNAAYNDGAGVTAKFNLNLLARINRELGADLDPATFSHQAFYNRERQRIEMHLASRVRQQVRVCGRTIEFRAGETIHTENSYKYTVESFGALARGAGWTPVAAWTDADGYFSVQALRAAK